MFPISVYRAEHRKFWRELPGGVRQGSRALSKEQDILFDLSPNKDNPLINTRSTESKQHRGRLFLSIFLIAKQKQKTRLWVREPTSKSSFAIATHCCVHPSTRSGRTAILLNPLMIFACRRACLEIR